ncbi:zinc carboxypeptidase [Streptococcus iniae]|uniref:M14 family zinc carboxypeptidase n=1 Tax=Streptococcus iniae TaxID=1346 RepID=UPI000EF80CC3|nr:M14 family zinc carboxypeptidase [Streptococcus iniae]RLU46883.1 zinc carboxypeptidase [Streptococcus iniae]
MTFTISHKSSADKVIKGLSASCMLLCTLALSQYVKAEEVIPADATASTVLATDSSKIPVIPAATDSSVPTVEAKNDLLTGPVTDTSQPKTTDVTKPVTDTRHDTPADSHLPSSTSPVTKTKPTEAAPLTSPINTGSQTVYMDKVTEISIDLPSAKAVTWTIENLPTNVYDIKSGQFSGDALISVQEQAKGAGIEYKISIKPLFGDDLSLRWPSNVRRTYRDYMKSYLLKGVDEAGQVIATKELDLRPYQDYKTHDELLKEISDIEHHHASDRLVTVETIGKSALNNDIKMGIIAKDQASIDAYLNQTTPAMLMTPDQALKLLGQGKFDYKLPILINNTHADEQPGIDIVRGLFKTFATQAMITYDTVDAQKKPQKVAIDISALLEKVILLFNFTENPDGDIANTRALNNGLDPNRDAGYQTNPETRAIVEQINKWNPIAVFDIHGFVKAFLIEPCTPPHDPNFEYDLFADNMVATARQMGNAGITNSKYDKYIIPKFDYGSGWDDSFSGYTAVYALYQGILGFTIEIPETNQESYDAGFYAVLAGINFSLQNQKELMAKRLAFYSRGIHKVEAEAAEKELVTADGSVKGRVKDGRAHFFPDYYVIPMELSENNDIDQAFKMIDYFRRNGVILNALTQDHAGFKKGDLVIDMAQAKRGFANHVLYKGSNESEWEAMYAELVMNFPAMRGFKATAVFQPNLFAGNLGAVTLSSAPRTSITENAPYYVIANNSLAAVQAVNEAIKSGKTVYLTTDGYVVDSATFRRMIVNYPLYAQTLNKRPVGKHLKALTIFAPGNPNASLGFKSPSEVSLALQQMGFTVVTSLEQADVLVLDNDQFDKDVLGKKPTIIIGGAAMTQLEKLGLISGFDAAMTDEKNGSSYEGLMRIELDDQSPYTSGYALKSLFYSNSGTWIESIPASFRKLAAISEKDFYISGWWPKHEGLAKKMVAVSGDYNGHPILIFAGNPTNKTHSINFYRWVSNAIYGTELANFEAIPMPTPSPQKPVQLAVNRLIHANDHSLNHIATEANTLVEVKYPEQKTAKNEIKAKAKTETNKMQYGLIITGLLVIAGGSFVALKAKNKN